MHIEFSRLQSVLHLTVEITNTQSYCRCTRLYLLNTIRFSFASAESAEEDGTVEEIVDRNCPPCRLLCRLWPHVYRAWLRYQTWIAAVLTHVYFERLVALIIVLNVIVLVCHLPSVPASRANNPIWYPFIRLVNSFHAHCYILKSYWVAKDAA